MAQCKNCKGFVSKKAKACPHCGHPNPARACFIATATYGTSMAKEINVLRKWRDDYLIKSWSGKLFVNSYYVISPPIADVISKSNSMKKITKKFLDPIVHFFDINMGNN